MTTAPTDLARKRSAEIVVQRPAPQVINGHTVRNDNGSTIAWVFTLTVLAILLTGFLLSAS